MFLEPFAYEFVGYVFSCCLPEYDAMIEFSVKLNLIVVVFDYILNNISSNKI